MFRLGVKICYGLDVRPVHQSYRLNRKNFCVSEAGLVTVFCPLTTTGSGETVLQTAGETRFVVACKVNPAALVRHVRITLAPEGIIVSGGALTDGNEMLNTVPLPELPASDAAP